MLELRLESALWPWCGWDWAGRAHW